MKTYKQQFDAITEAYMHDEIRPFKPDFCFCGTLCGNESYWFGYFALHATRNNPAVHYDCAGYSGRELGLMEYQFLIRIHEVCGTSGLFDQECFENGEYTFDANVHPNYEQAVYEGMVAALEVLRQIHLSKGDETAQPITLQKRTLCAAQ